jgi:hypothetical protein
MIRMMKLALTLTLTLTLRAAPPPEFIGLLSLDGASQFCLLNRATDTTRWLKLGGTFQGFTIVTYDASAEILILSRDTEELRLALPRAAVKLDNRISAEATAAVRSNLRLLAAAAKRHFLEGKSRYATLDDLVGPGKPIAQLVPAAGEDYRGLSFMKGETGELRVTTLGGEVILARTATE